MEQNLTFADLGLSAEVLQALEQKGYGYPTKIQAEAIPPFMEWKDVIAKAPTGTGKTFAFGIPMIEHIDAGSEDLQGLILAPTRELAIQIGDELRGLLTFSKKIRVAVVYGGAKIESQIKQLEKHPQIVVATPGRLMDHYKRKTLRLDPQPKFLSATMMSPLFTLRMKPRSKSSMQWLASSFGSLVLRYRAGMITSVSTLSP